MIRWGSTNRADPRQGKRRLVANLALSVLLPLVSHGEDVSTSELKSLSVEDLMNIDVTSVSKTLTQMQEALHFAPGSSGLLGTQQVGDDPSHQAHLRTSMNLPANLTFDADLRYVGWLPNPYVNAYEELNARLGWRPSRRWEMALVGANLLHARHVEYTVPPDNVIARSAMLDVRFRL
ncbi:MAG TPA: hypothetical protein VHY75_09085 [Steroidobacteraceae bacterium]|jgi:hypothetical protein|nr:hypothetical protein [Steroidobacteraceae bacterium]